MIELFEQPIVRVLTVFSLSPGSRLNRETLKSKTLMNNISVNKAIYALLNLQFIEKDKNNFGLNFNNPKLNYILGLISENYTRLRKLPLNEYFFILDISYELSKIKNIGDVYLFGSYSKLIFKESSDIDIAVISDNLNKKEINLIISKLEKKQKKVIELHFFTKDFYNNRRDPLVKEILQNGIKLL